MNNYVVEPNLKEFIERKTDMFDGGVRDLGDAVNMGLERINIS
jgi:hypothetical protein